MKKTLSIAVAALLACTANAQDYNRVTFGYQSLDLHNNKNISSIASNGTLDGFKVGYTHGFALTSNAPLFLEVGADVSFNASSSDVTYISAPLTGVGYKSKNKTCGVTVPVSLGYKISISNNVWLEPYAGACIKFNLVGKTKHEFKNAPGMKNADINWFKSADMSSEDLAGSGDDLLYYNNMGGSACKRVQFGGQVGVNLGYKRVNLNVAYQMLSLLQETDNFKINTRSFTVGVGYNF